MRLIDSSESAYTFATVLIGDDTNLLILLVYNACVDSCALFFKPEPKKTTKHPRNIPAVKMQLGLSVCNHILFLHAILGCDTTSQPHSIGKLVSMQVIEVLLKF
jgi:hypothetical protein